MKPAKDMKTTLRYKLMVKNLHSRPAHIKEAALLKEIVGGKQWRMDAVLEAIGGKIADWHGIDMVTVFKQAAMFGRLSTIQKIPVVFNGRTDRPLHMQAALDMAVLHNHKKIADYCMSFGLTKSEITPCLFNAMNNGNKKAVDYLIKAGADFSFFIENDIIKNNKQVQEYLKKNPSAQTPKP